MTFYGYKRPDGRVGVRNHVLILPASVCASDTTRIIAQQVTGAVTFNNQQGCSQVAPDQQLTMDVMAGYAANPNVYGTVVVSLGCENCQMDLVVKAIEERTNKPLKQVIIQEAGGTLKAVDMAVRYAKEMVAEASMLQKEEFPISELIVGTDEQGEYLAKANSLWSLLDVGTGKPVMVNEAMHKGYEIDEKLDMEYAPRKIAVPEGGELLEPIVVKKHHLDTNHHVNNGQYVNIAMEYLPDDFVIRQMRAEYKKQAFLDDVLHPYVVSTENDYVICLQDEAGKPYVSVEFQGQ